jgi:hypothetical protein
MKTAVQAVAGATIAVLLPGVIFGQAAGSEPGSLCIAPVLEKPDGRSSPGLVCDSEKLSLRIDAQPAIPWPKIPEQDGTHRSGKSLKIDALDAGTRHRVVVSCNGKPQQSFTFRFSDFKTHQLCLFINDLYKTVQLWEAKASPWCKCK